MTAERQDAPPRFIAVRYVLRVVTHQPRQRVELLHPNIRRHGTIFNTLAAVCDVAGDIVAEPAIPHRDGPTMDDAARSGQAQRKPWP